MSQVGSFKWVVCEWTEETWRKKLNSVPVCASSELRSSVIPYNTQSVYSGRGLSVTVPPSTDQGKSVCNWTRCYFYVSLRQPVYILGYVSRAIAALCDGSIVPYAHTHAYSIRTHAHTECSLYGLLVSCVVRLDSSEVHNWITSVFPTLSVLVRLFVILYWTPPTDKSQPYPLG